MQGRGLAAAGLVIFLLLVFSPFFHNAVTGKGGYEPKLALPAEARQCVEEKEYMKAHHVDLLKTWKERVVRDGERTYVARDGKSYAMSLRNTCMKCHASKEGFCDRCHSYAGVKTPACWDCHVAPKEISEKREARVAKREDR